MNYSDLIIFIMEMMGTVAFAASGAMLGIRKKMDLFRGLRSWGDNFGRRRSNP